MFLLLIMVQVLKNRYQGLDGQTIQLIIEVRKKKNQWNGKYKNVYKGINIEFQNSESLL